MTDTAVNPAYARIHRGECLEVPLGAGEQKGRNRELIMPSRGTGKVFLKYKDTRFTWYNLPLGKAATRGRDEAPTPEKNVLVPVLPRVYTTPEPDPAKCAVPRAPGWLYIFKGGYLWRELEVLPQGRFRDVNLHKYAGRDVRPATVEKDDRILLPYRLDDVEQDIRMAYADVQWSWARINMLGGMDPDDFRLHPDHLPPMPEEQGYTQDVIAEQQAARLQQIDLSGFDAGFPVQPPEGRKARVENVEHANDRLIHIRLHRKANIPVVYLDDPLGVARALAAEHQNAWRNLAEYIEELADPANRHRHPYAPWFDSAVLANQYFFVEHPEVETANVETYPGQPRQGEWEQARKLRAEWRKRLSLEDIQTALGTRRRAELRARIVEARDALVAWLSPENEHFPQLLAAWDDYCTLPATDRLAHDGPHSGQRYELANLLLAKLGDHEYKLDLHLETEPPSQKRLLEIERNSSGRRLLARIGGLLEGHPLHARLFLPAETGSATGNTMSGNLPAAAFSPLIDAHTLARLGRRSAAFLVGFLEHYAGIAAEARYSSLQTSLVELLVEAGLVPRVAKKDVDLGAFLRGRLPDELAAEFDIAAMRLREVERDIPYPARRRFDGGDAQTAQGPGGPIIIEDNKGNVVGSTSLAAYREGRGLSRTRMKKRFRERSFDRVNVEVWLWRKVRGLPALAETLKDEHGIMKLLLPIVVVLEGWNLQNALVAFRKASPEDNDRTRLANEFGNAIADTLALAAYLNELRVNQQIIIANSTLKILRRKIATASFWAGGLGLVANVYSAGLSFQDMLRNAHEGDDAAIAHGVMTLGFAAGAVGSGLQATGAVYSLLGLEASGLLASGIGAAGTVALIGLGVVLAGVALLIWVFREDTPLEEWLANGPFSVAPPAEDELALPTGAAPDRAGRFAGYRPGDPVESRFHVWYLQPRSAHDDLLDAICRPVADLRVKTPLTGESRAELAVHLPNYIEDQSRLFVEWWEITRHGERRRAEERNLRIRTGFGNGPRSVRQWLPVPRDVRRIEVRLWLDLYGDGRYRLPLAPLRWTGEEAEAWRKAAVEGAIRPAGRVRVSGKSPDTGEPSITAARGLEPIELSADAEYKGMRAL